MSLTLLPSLILGLLQTPPALPPEPATDPAAAPVAAPIAAPQPAPTAAPVIAPAPAVGPAPVYYMADAGPVPTSDPASAPELVDAQKYRRLVFSNFYTLNFGLFPVPSGEVSVFLGTNLRPRRSVLGTDWNTAIGYQVTLSLGLADIYTGEESSTIQNESCFDEFFCPQPIFYHRHALMAQGHGGRNGRLYYALGGGALMWNSSLVGIEGEGRLGYIFSKREASRVKGVVGGQLRLSGALDGVPRPQFGLFVGLMVF